MRARGRVEGRLGRIAIFRESGVIMGVIRPRKMFDQ